MTQKELLEQNNQNIKELKDSFSREIETIKTILNGNGKPEQGIVFRLAILEEHIKKFTPKNKTTDQINKWLIRIAVFSLAGHEGLKAIFG